MKTEGKRRKLKTETIGMILLLMVPLTFIIVISRINDKLQTNGDMTTIEENETEELDIIPMPQIPQIEAKEFLPGADNPDYPSNITFFGVNSYNAIQIPNDGTYLIRNKVLSKYYNGEKVKIEGESLEWLGFDPQEINMYEYIGEDYVRLLFKEPRLIYDNVNDHLYMVTFEVDDTATYLYVFPDRNVSKIEFLGAISSYEIDEEGMVYTTVDGSTKY